MAGSIVLTIGVNHGLGQHVWDLVETKVPKVIMFDYITQALGLSASCLGRVAFTIYVLHLLGSEKSQKIILRALVAAQLVTNVVSILIMFLQCPSHGSAIWNRPGKAKCWDVRVQAYYGYFQGCMYGHQPVNVPVVANIFMSHSFQLGDGFVPCRLPNLHILELEYENQGKTWFNGIAWTWYIVRTSLCRFPSFYIEFIY